MKTKWEQNGTKISDIIKKEDNKVHKIRAQIALKMQYKTGRDDNSKTVEQV